MLVPNPGSIPPLRGYKTIMPPMATFLFYGRGDRNRTCDPLHPMQVLYQAELRPDNGEHTNPRLYKTQIFFIEQQKTAIGGFYKLRIDFT